MKVPKFEITQDIINKYFTDPVTGKIFNDPVFDNFRFVEKSLIKNEDVLCDYLGFESSFKLKKVRDECIFKVDPKKINDIYCDETCWTEKLCLLIRYDQDINFDEFKNYSFGERDNFIKLKYEEFYKLFKDDDLTFFYLKKLYEKTNNVLIICSNIKSKNLINTFNRIITDPDCSNFFEEIKSKTNLGSLIFEESPYHDCFYNIFKSNTEKALMGKNQEEFYDYYFGLKYNQEKKDFIRFILEDNPLTFENIEKFFPISSSNREISLFANLIRDCYNENISNNLFDVCKFIVDNINNKEIMKIIDCASNINKHENSDLIKRIVDSSKK